MKDLSLDVIHKWLWYVFYESKFALTCIMQKENLDFINL